MDLGSILVGLYILGFVFIIFTKFLKLFGIDLLKEDNPPSIKKPSKENEKSYWVTDYTLLDVKSIDPDSFWGQLREEVLDRDEHTCTMCKTSSGFLTVHHKIPLSLGGRNELKNLTTLCIKCHEKIHNTKFFDNFENDDLDNYGKNIKLKKNVKYMANIIHSNQNIEITYSDRENNKTHRVITPQNMMYDFDKPIIYVRAYCHLRKADRTFRLSRMSDFKIV